MPPKSSPAQFKAAVMRTPPRCLPYSSETCMDVYDALKCIDQKLEAPSERVRLLYSECDARPGERNREYACGWTREHVYPKSHGGLRVDVPGAGTDLHNLFAEDASVNSARGDKDFSDRTHCPGIAEELWRAVQDATPSEEADTEGGPRLLRARTCADFWEPPDACKGRVARALMYMACQYSDDLGLRLVDRTTRYPEPCFGMLSAVLDWNAAFPPDAEERLRNDRVEQIQGNRNPFIDDHTSADGIRFSAT